MINSITQKALALLFFISLALFANRAVAVDIDISDAATPDETAVDQTVAVFISSPQGSSVSVYYETVDGTATAGDDYTAQSGTLTFSAGSTVERIQIPILADTLDEDTETIIINLSSASGGTIVDSQAIVYITDDDEPPTITIDDVTATDETPAASSFTVTLSAATSREITLNYATANGTATAGEDYTAASGSITIPANTTTATSDVSVLDDSLDEFDETVFINISDATNSSITDSQGILTIQDDDTAPTLSIGDMTISDETGVAAQIPVTLSAASSRTVTVIKHSR